MDTNTEESQLKRKRKNLLRRNDTKLLKTTSGRKRNTSLESFPTVVPDLGEFQSKSGYGKRCCRKGGENGCMYEQFRLNNSMNLRK